MKFSFRPHFLQLLGAVHKLRRVCLWHDPPLIGFLHEELVPLLLGKADGVVLALEVEMRALHHVGRRLPPHKRILPAVALTEDVPVHAPVVAVPVARLSGRFGGLKDTAGTVSRYRRNPR